MAGTAAGFWAGQGEEKRTDALHTLLFAGVPFPSPLSVVVVAICASRVVLGVRFSLESSQGIMMMVIMMMMIMMTTTTAQVSDSW